MNFENTVTAEVHNSLGMTGIDKQVLTLHVKISISSAGVFHEISQFSAETVKQNGQCLWKCICHW